MIGGAIGKRYATALYELAEDHKVTGEVGKNLASLAAAWSGSDEIRHVFSNPRFGAGGRRKVVEGLTSRLSCHPMVKNTMLLLADRRRLQHLPEIAESFTRLAEERAGLLRAEVITATKMPELYYTSLTTTLKQATGKDVVLVRSEDPSLLGGVVTTVGGRVFDGSLKNRLQGLRAQLLASTDPALAER